MSQVYGERKGNHAHIINEGKLPSTGLHYVEPTYLLHSLSYEKLNIHKCLL